MRLIFTAGVILALATRAASAADMPVYDPGYQPPQLRSSHDWTGGYAGLHGGYGRGKVSPSGGAGGGGGLLGGLLGGVIDLGGTGGLLDGLLGGLGLDGLVDGLLGALDAGDLLDDLLTSLGGITEGQLGLDLEAALDADLSALDLGLRGSDVETEIEGFLGGAQIGYNVQRGSFVFGLEGDIAATDMTDSKSFSGSDSIVAVSAALEDLEIAEVAIDATVSGEVESELNWLSTLRGRFGFAVDRVLIFGTGGIAFGDMDVAARLTTSVSAQVELLDLSVVDLDIPVTTVSGSGGGLMVGYTLGAGIEYAITENWAARLEYAYVNLGEVEVDFEDGSSTDMEIDMHLVKGAVNYYF